jgi:hypothetical protein
MIFSIDKIWRQCAVGFFVLCMAVIPSPVYAQFSAAEAEAYIASKPAALVPAYRKLVAEGARNSVLNNMEIASLALRLGDQGEAANAIDRALLDIKKYYGHTEAAAKARSLWFDEGSKEFKGEPYERAMAFYYRGMLDLQAGDYGNAQASFSTGFLQDAFAEEEQHASDFAILAFLTAWALERNDNPTRAEDYYKELALLRPDFKRPPKTHDTLIVVETGKSPRKLADGIGHAELVYRRGKKFPDRGVVFGVGEDYAPTLIEDIYFQASTRGARPVDRILEGKIKYKKVREKSGTQIANIGNDLHTASILSGSGTLGYVSSGVSILGALQLFSAQNVKPRADTRYWTGLPDMIHIFTYNSKLQGAGDISVQYLDKSGQPIPDMAVNIPRTADKKGRGLIWVVSQS